MISLITQSISTIGAILMIVCLPKLSIPLFTKYLVFISPHFFSSNKNGKCPAKVHTICMFRPQASLYLVESAGSEQGNVIETMQNKFRLEIFFHI